MPIPSPFHERTAPLCTSYKWKDWAGYYAVCSYDTTHDREYFAFREATGMIDVTPLYKYEVFGPDAAALLSRMMVRNVRKLRVGRVGYTCWCDDAGKVVDDGTVSRLDDAYFRVTAADPTLHWLESLAHGYDVTIEDSTRRLAALALQGPTSRDVLNSCCEKSLDKLRFFRVTRTRIDGLDVWISRTGYTGDLGYEVWVESDSATQLWDRLIEAGFVMLHVDYFSSTKVILESRKSTPYEIGLGWTVKLNRAPFMGQAALKAEKRNGPAWQLVGLELDWPELEALYESYDLPPALAAEACREALPVYDGGRQVGRVTSHTWSPVLKRMIALASVRTPWAVEGKALQVEHTVEYERHTVSARVTPTPFFDPPRKRAIVKDRGKNAG